ncbi:MAG: hypothetical protein QNL12_10185 [Acidimicrobiia bacterium]|nr:hypothetical protein [Acidimicrobiia bacterium]
MSGRDHDPACAVSGWFADRGDMARKLLFCLTLSGGGGCVVVGFMGGVLMDSLRRALGPGVVVQFDLTVGYRDGSYLMQDPPEALSAC